MKTKEIGKTVAQLAAEVVASKNVRIFKNDRGGIGIEFDKYDGREIVESIAYIDVKVHRSIYEKQNISYPVWIDAIDKYGGPKIFKMVDTAEEAFAIMDILEAAIRDTEKTIADLVLERIEEKNAIMLNLELDGEKISQVLLQATHDNRGA